MFNVYICVSQELLSSRKSELKITEEIIHEKDGEKENLEKRIEATRRRQSYVEKKIVEKVMFEKPEEKKWCINIDNINVNINYVYFRNVIIIQTLQTKPNE